VQLVQAEAPEIQSLLIAIMYFASKGDPNVVTGNRYGLLQIDLTQARNNGFTGEANQLLEPEINVQLGAQLLIKLGLVQFAGRDLAPQIPAILQMENFLARNTEDNQASLSR